MKTIGKQQIFAKTTDINLYTGHDVTSQAFKLSGETKFLGWSDGTIIIYGPMAFYLFYSPTGMPYNVEVSLSFLK